MLPDDEDDDDDVDDEDDAEEVAEVGGTSQKETGRDASIRLSRVEFLTLS